MNSLESSRVSNLYLSKEVGTRFNKLFINDKIIFHVKQGRT